MRTQLTNVRANSIRPLLTATLALAITFTLSCSGGDDPDDNGGGGNNGSGGGGNNQFNENSQIYNKDGNEYNGSGVIKIRLSASYDNGNYSEIAVNAGSVSNGIVKLELPPTISDEYLCYPEENNCLYLFSWGLGDRWGLWGEDEIEKENEGCMVSPEDVKIFGTDNFRLYNNSDGIGIGKFYDWGYHDDDGNEYFIEYLYFTKAAKITCDNKFKKFDIDAKAGWNKVYIKDPDSDDCEHDPFNGPNGKEICKAIVSSNNFFTKELKWDIKIQQ
jgi:hypothetical protein